MIQIHFENVEVPGLNQELFCSWLERVIQTEGSVLGDIQFVFCSDEYLLDINRKFLNHDYYTDVITFDYCENQVVSGDLFVSIERVKDNALSFSSSFLEEFLRVSVHGVLHLLGYKDKTDEDIAMMRGKEQFYLDDYVSRGT